MQFSKRTKCGAKLGWVGYAQLALVTLVAFGCQGRQLYFQAFTYPNDIPAHESGWEYMCRFAVTTNAKGSMILPSDKTTRITILDADEIEIFSHSESFEDVAGIRAEVEWKEAGSLLVKIVEHTTAPAGGEKNGVGIDGVSQVLRVMHIRLEKKTGEFEVSPR